MRIIMYITDCPGRVISGAPLALDMPNNDERQRLLETLAETFEAGVIELPNGDHMLVGQA